MTATATATATPTAPATHAPRGTKEVHDEDHPQECSARARACSGRRRARRVRRRRQQRLGRRVDDVRRRHDVHPGARLRPGQPRPAGRGRQRALQLTQFAYDTLVSVDGDTGDDPVRSWRPAGRSPARPSRSRSARASPAPTAASFTASDRRRQRRLRRGPEEQEPVPGHLPPGRRQGEGGRRDRHGHDHAGRSPRRSCSTAWPACRWSARPGWPTARRWPRRPTAPARIELTEAAPGDHYTYQVRDGLHLGTRTARRPRSKGMPGHRRDQGRREREHAGQPAGLGRSERRRRDRGPDATRLEKRRPVLRRDPGPAR